MIFVTIGTQLPFPRLVDALAELAPALDEEIIAQVGPDDTPPRAGITQHATLPPAEFKTLFAQARVVVAHAGIGSILSAKAARKPLIVLPRRFDRGEHRNDHQLATAQAVQDVTGIHVTWQTEDLLPLLQQPDLAPANPTPGPQAAPLIARLRELVDM